MEIYCVLIYLRSINCKSRQRHDVEFFILLLITVLEYLFFKCFDLDENVIFKIYM